MFIVIEGVDGTGQSTLAQALVERLGTDRVVLTREPTADSSWGRQLRQSAAEGRLSREEEIEYFHRDRLHHLETLIRPALASGKIVICDRYVDSTLAYQAASPEEADRLYERMKAELLEPDIVFVLDCPVDLALKRIGDGRDGHSRFERKETLETASRIYASREGQRYHHLDAAKPPEVVLEEALAVLERHGLEAGKT
jgi:dTMP kinase